MALGKTGSVIHVLFLAAFAIVAGNAYLAFRSVQVLQESQAWVTHSWQVIHAMDQIQSELKSAETANRDYLLTRAPEDLSSYQAAKAALPRHLADFRRLTADNLQQQVRSEQIEQVIENRMGSLDGALSSHNAAGLALTVHGKSAMDQVQNLSESMQQEESALLVQRTAKAHKNAIQTRITVLFASLLDLALLLFMIRQLQRERSLRDSASATAAQLARLQSLSDVALSQLTLTELTSHLLSTVRQMVDADSAALGTVREGALTVIAAEGTPAVPGESIPIANAPLLARIIAAPTPTRLGHQDEPARELGALVPADSASVMLAPLRQYEQVSAILIAGRRTLRPFTENDEQLLSVTADRIAIAIDRAEAYESERTARRLAEASAAEIQELNTVLEERVRQRTAELETTNKELEAFSYSVSHDLRAPLRTIDGFSLALEEDYGKIIDSNGKNYIRRVRAGVQRMGLLIDALLQLSRITRADLVREPMDISAAAQTIADELAQQNRARAIEFHIEANLSVEADVQLVRAALENLLGNAVKFTSKMPSAVVEFGWSPEQQAYYVRDNGAGFDQQYAGKLFHAFNRLHGDKDFTGSGIGLATVARVIARHQGHIWAEGKVGQGATFWFTLNDTASTPAQVADTELAPSLASSPHS